MNWKPSLPPDGGIFPSPHNDGQPVVEPPCRWCRHFLPVFNTSVVEGAMRINGVRLCHATSMKADFGCFSERKFGDAK